MYALPSRVVQVGALGVVDHERRLLRRTSACCWVNGCHRWRRSAAASSAVVRMRGNVAPRPVGICGRPGATGRPVCACLMAPMPPSRSRAIALAVVAAAVRRRRSSVRRSWSLVVGSGRRRARVRSSRCSRTTSTCCTRRPRPSHKHARHAQALGVDSVRVTVLWVALAPDADLDHGARRLRRRAIPPPIRRAAGRRTTGWSRSRRARGIGVDFNVTAPGPAVGDGAGEPDAATLRRPLDRRPPPRSGSSSRPSDAATAAATRRPERRRGRSRGSATGRSGTSRTSRLAGAAVADGRRPDVDARAGAVPRVRGRRLRRRWPSTGHEPSTDTILIGELAPEGCEPGGRAVLAENRRSRRCRSCGRCTAWTRTTSRCSGAAAARRRAARRAASPSAFVAANPALFEATGFAHHPYSFFLAPSGLDAAIRTSRRCRTSAGSSRRSTRIFARLRGPPPAPDLYLTEYGYETNPPNPFRGVRPRRQALYLDEAAVHGVEGPAGARAVPVPALRLAARHDVPPGQQRVLVDVPDRARVCRTAPPSRRSTPTGCRSSSPTRACNSGAMLVWAMLRPAPHDSSQHAQIQWQPAAGGGFRTLASVGTHSPNGVLVVHVTVPAPGSGADRVARARRRRCSTAAAAVQPGAGGAKARRCPPRRPRAATAPATARTASTTAAIAISAVISSAIGAGSVRVGRRTVTDEGSGGAAHSGWSAWSAAEARVQRRGRAGAAGARRRARSGPHCVKSAKYCWP